MMLFTEGLQDRFRGLVKVLKPNTLDDAIKIARDLDSPSSILQPPKKPYKRVLHQIKGIKTNQKPLLAGWILKHKMSSERRNCALPAGSCGLQITDALEKGKIHYVEVQSEDEGE